MAIHNADELAQYALRQLGHPVIQINVSDDQVQDAIENALTKYSRRRQSAHLSEVYYHARRC